MAIVQSRMIALINAAMDYRRAYERILEILQQQRANINQGRASYEQAFITLETMLASKELLMNESESKYIIAFEHYHFSKNQARNVREARRMAERRGHEPTRRHWTPPFTNTDQILVGGATRQSGQSKQGLLGETQPPLPGFNDSSLNDEILEAARQARIDEEQEAAQGQVEDGQDFSLDTTNLPDRTNPVE